MSRFLAYSTIALAVAASACSTYSVRRAALVPHQQPLQRSGQGIGSSRIELGLGTPNLGSIGAPEEAEGANAGIVLPRHEVTGNFRARVTENFDLGLLWDHGFDEGSRKVSEDMPNPDNGDVMGYGVSAYFSAPIDPSFSLGIGADLLMYSIPYVEYSVCVDNCPGGQFTIIDEDRDTIPVISLGIIPSWKLSDRVVLFAGATLRNHPTIEKSDVETGPDLFDDEEVDMGPENLVLSAGVEVKLAAGIRGMAYVHQPAAGDPVDYGPTFGIGFSIPLIRDQPAQGPLAGQPPTAPPGPYPPPPPPSY